MEEATIVSWLVPSGAAVRAGDPVLVIETDKVETEIAAEETGYLVPLVASGAVASVGSVLGELHPSPPPDAGDAPGNISARPPGSAAANGKEAIVPAWRRVRASMAARSLARSRDVDLDRVDGTGPGGRVVHDDVEQFLAGGESLHPDASGSRAASPPAQPAASDGETFLPPAGTIRLAGRRAAIARHLERSRANAVPLTLNRFAPCRGLCELRERVNRNGSPETFTITEVAARLVVAVLRRHPQLNARATPEGADLFEAVNLGVAVDTDEGLIVPVVHHAEHLNLRSLAARLRALVAASRSATLSSADLEHGTFTITNLGAYQVDFGTPVLNWPQVAILGLGRISAATGQPQIGLSLTVDHRLIDGVPAARFLDDVASAFDDPGSALL